MAGQVEDNSTPSHFKLFGKKRQLSVSDCERLYAMNKSKGGHDVNCNQLALSRKKDATTVDQTQYVDVVVCNCCWMFKDYNSEIRALYVQYGTEKTNTSLSLGFVSENLHKFL